MIRRIRSWLQPVLRLRFRLLGRPPQMLETSKARPRREREGFFERYCTGRGLDIGYGGDLLTSSCIGWDIEHGDAEVLRGVDDESFDFVYSSHLLEHVRDPASTVRRWWRVVKPGGYLILYVPHRDLYEKQLRLPSRWNPDHRRYFLPDRDDPPDTIGILPLLRTQLDGCRVISVRECSEGLTIMDPELHSDGEYSIECVVQKPVSH